MTVATRSRKTQQQEQQLQPKPSNDNEITYSVYPSHCLGELQRRYGSHNVKLIHMVRHAEGTHNVDRRYNDPIHLDARLTNKGIDQCHQLAQLTKTTIVPPHDCTVLTSPMTRCVQTALLSFPHLVSAVSHRPVEFIALEGLRETVNYQCDRRRSILELAKEFPQIRWDEDDPYYNDDGSNVDDDGIWNYYQQWLGTEWHTHRESAQLTVVMDRARMALDYMYRRVLTSQVVICTHSAFLRCIVNWGQTGGIPRLMPQVLDETFDPTTHIPLFRYCASINNDDDDDDDDTTFEQEMRRDYDNCELRSFVLVRPQLNE